MRCRFIVLAPLLVSALMGGCAQQHRHLSYSPALQAGNGGETRYLRAGEPIDSILGVVDLLLGPEIVDLPLDPFLIDEARLDAVFPEPEARADVAFSYRFLHFTDVQLRDRGAGVGQRLERLVDRYIVFTQNNFYQDHADLLYFAFVATAMRQLLDRGGHEFVVHTGDAMHMSTDSELAAFNKVLEQMLMHDPADRSGCLECWADHGWLTPAFRIAGDPLPRHRFFNVLGNHDVLRWGNWTRDDDRMVAANETDIASASELEAAVAELGGRRTVLVDPSLPLQPRLADDVPPAGFYAVDVPLPAEAGDDKVARLVVLNMYEASPRGQFGTRADEAAVSAGQVGWLQSVLDRSQADPRVDHVLVLGHERLWLVAIGDGEGVVGQRGKLGRILGRYPKVVAYLSGHAHSGASPHNPHVVALRYPFAHYTLPSLMEYPKIFSSFTVQRRLDGSFRIQAQAVDLVDLGVIPEPFAAAESTVELDARVHTDQQRAFEEWLGALDALCGSDVGCRARQLASECLQAAIVDRPDRVVRWGASRAGFVAEVEVPRTPRAATQPRTRRGDRVKRPRKK
jgi:3',5'-cyclic AMP phosphodiesterase CpdA